MADVTCANCREPWDTHHLRYDAIWDTDLRESLKRRVSNEGANIKDREQREALERDGWKFGGSLLSILRCPACKSNEERNGPLDPEVVKDREMRRSVLADILGDDEDGLQSELEDLDYLDQ